jgi:mycobactin peptide synthetase MbtE
VPSGIAESVEFAIDAATRDKLAVLCRDLGVTEFMLVQAAVAVVLHKAGGGSDIPIGSPVSGRGEPELDQLVGFFINILVLRNDLHGDPTLREVLQRAREMSLAAYAHQDLPFDQVVDAVSPVRSLSRNPLFAVVVHLRDDLPTDQVIDRGPAGDTSVTVLEPTFDAAHADLSLNFFASENGYRGHVIYRPELYTRQTAQRMVGWLQRVLGAFADDPGQRLRDVEIGAAGEVARIAGWSGGQLYVLDAALRPVPVGVVGDVYSGGPIAEGQWNRAELSAIRFVPNPFASDDFAPVGAAPGSRLHRTGDQARWSEQGVLELVERVQDQVRPAVRPDSAQADEAPATDTEQALARMLGEVLDVSDPAKIRRHDDFFALGGDSILAVQLAARARDAGIKLTARMVFENPALCELAVAVDTAAEAADLVGIDGGSDSDDGGDTWHAPMSASGLSADDLAALTSSWNASSWSASRDGAQ